MDRQPHRCAGCFCSRQDGARKQLKSRAGCEPGTEGTGQGWGLGVAGKGLSKIPDNVCVTPRTPGSLRTPPICKIRAAHFLANLIGMPLTSQPPPLPPGGSTQGSHLGDSEDGGLTGEPGHSILITHSTRHQPQPQALQPRTTRARAWLCPGPGRTPNQQ